MAKNNEAKIKFTADTKEYNAQIKSSNSVMKEQRAEFKLNEAQYQNTGDAVEYLQNKHKILETQLEANKAKQEALSQKVELAKKIYGENSSEAQALSTQLVRVKTETETLTSKVSQCENEMKQQAETAKQQETTLDKLNSEIATQETELEKLKNQYKNTVLEQGKSSKEAQQLKKQINSLSSELGENKTKLNQAEKAFNDLGTAAKTSGEKAEESSDGYTVVKDVIADLASEAISGAVEGFKDLATEGEAALDKMNAKIGATGEAAEKYTNVAKNVYKNGWGKSLEDTSNAVATIVMQLGYLEEADLQKITENSMTLSDVYEFDIAESIRTVKSLMDQFGISADDAFNLIVQGAQEGLNQNGDMLDVINEYSVQFSDAGYSAENMFNMIANGYTEGSWSVDKLGDALKEFKIKMMDGSANDYLEMLGLNAKKITAEYAKGGDSARAATDKVIQALISCKDPQEQYIAGQGIMGTMWEDLGVDAVNALMKTNGELSNSKDAMEQLKTDAYDNLSTSVSTLGNTFKVELLQPLVDSVSPALTDVVNKVTEVISVVSDTIQKSPELQSVLIGIATALSVVAVALGISALISGVQKAFAALNTTMLANPIFLVVAAIAALVAGLVYAYNNCESFRNAVDKAFSFIKELLTSVKTFFTDTFNDIGQKLSNAKENITGTFNNIKNSITQKLTSAKENVSNIFNSVKNTMGTILGSAKNTVSEKLNNIKNAYVSNGGGIKGAAAAIMEGVKGYFSTGLSFINNLTGGKLSSIANTFKNKLNMAKNSVKSIIDKIKGFFNFKISWPKIPTPHFSIKPNGWSVGDLLKGIKPDLDISWYAKGKIFKKPTIFSTPYGLKGVGEAGPEAVAPIDVLQDYVQDAVENANSSYENMDYDLLALKIARACASVEQVMKIDGREVGRVMRTVI